MLKYSKNKLQSNSLNQSVGIYINDSTNDGFGKSIKVPLLIGNTRADVKQVSEFRQMQYNALGYGRTYDIRMRKPSFSFEFLEYNGSKLEIHSMIDQDNRGEWLTITAYSR